MKLGFTGTRDELTSHQRGFLREVFRDSHIDEVHHGACVGADHEFHLAALAHGKRIVVHPPVKKAMVAMDCLEPKQANVTSRPEAPYLHRDRNIVYETDALLGMPKKTEEQGGGSWYTIHYAVRLCRPVVIVYPDGRIERRTPQ